MSATHLAVLLCLSNVAVRATLLRNRAVCLSHRESINSLGTNVSTLDANRTIRLINTMALLSLKADGQRYFFGYLWWVLEPLLWVAIFYVVFDVLLATGRADFLAFLLVGKFTFIWFSKAVIRSASSLTGNAGFIGKMSLPKWLFPMVICLESLYRQLAVVAVMLVMLFVMNYEADIAWLWLLPLMLTQCILICAYSLLAAILVCIRDDLQLIIQLSMALLLFVSGIFWDVNAIVNEDLRDYVLLFNPLASLIDLNRTVLLQGAMPDLRALLVVLAHGVFVLVATSLIYREAGSWIARRVLLR